MAKTAFRKEQHAKMARQWDKNAALRVAKLGGKVGIIPDKRDMTRSRNIPGVVFSVGEGGGVSVVTKHGILVAYDKKKEPFYLPVDQYTLMEDLAPLGPKLEDLRKRILTGRFSEVNRPRLGMKEQHRKEFQDTCTLEYRSTCMLDPSNYVVESADDLTILSSIEILWHWGKNCMAVGTRHIIVRNSNSM